MRQPIKLIVKKGVPRADGTRLISLQYCHSTQKRVVLGTGIAIPPKFWNRKSSRISKDLPTVYGDVEKLESILTEKLRKAEDMVTAAQKRNTCPINFLKVNFPLADNWKIEHLKQHKNEVDVFHNIDLYIEETRTEVKQCTLNVIDEMKQRLKKFEEYRNRPITFDSFDFEFYADFMRYLTYEYPLRRKKEVIRGLRVNTLGKTIKWLKTFLKNRMAKKSSLI